MARRYDEPAAQVPSIVAKRAKGAALPRPANVVARDLADWLLRTADRLESGTQNDGAPWPEKDRAKAERLVVKIWRLFAGGGDVVAVLARAVSIASHGLTVRPDNDRGRQTDDELRRDRLPFAPGVAMTMIRVYLPTAAALQDPRVPGLLYRAIESWANHGAPTKDAFRVNKWEAFADLTHAFGEEHSIDHLKKLVRRTLRRDPATKVVKVEPRL